MARPSRKGREHVTVRIRLAIVRSTASSAERNVMSYKVAGIDVHKKVLMVVVATVAEEVADVAGEAIEFECRRFGAGASERNHIVGWLRERTPLELSIDRP